MPHQGHGFDWKRARPKIIVNGTPFYILEDAARIAGAHPKTLQRAASEGRIVSIRLEGQKYRYLTADEIIAYHQARTSGNRRVITPAARRARRRRPRRG